MTLGALSGSDSSSAVSFCSCCGAKMVPYFSDDAVVSKNQINQLISESFLTVKGAALFLPRGNSPTPSSAPRISQRRNKHTGDLQKHLQTMFTVLRPEDTIRLAVRLESAYPQVTRYMVVVSTNGRQDTEESIVLGMDFVSSDSCCTVGLVLPLWSDTLIHLDGDGGFSVSTVSRVHVFKPVSVQAMWSSLQSLHKACEVARCHNYYPGSLFLTWVSYYQSRISSNQFCINEWNAMQDVESHRANSPVLFTDLPTERERTERLIKMRLREIMMQKDLENVTCKEIRTELEMQMVCNLREFKEFIDNEMIVILGQMDSPTEIFEHVYLGSEWNASNLEELQNSGVRYILNVTREIDNFFPGMFEYHNIRVYDEEATNLLEYWNETYKFITKAKKAGAKCLVHCKMGVSRSASTVIAYAMKEYGWDLDTAFDYVKERRAVTKPNPSFMKQLEEYQGILLASKQRHNKLWRSHSDSDLSDRPESVCKASPHPLARSDSHNNNTAASSPSLHHFLGVAVLQALGAHPEDSSRADGAHASDSPGDSDSACDSPGREGAAPPRSPSPSPPLPRPRAATLVLPEERPDSSASVAITVPVALPHPPPSLHVLPPTPELRRAHRGPHPTQLPIPTGPEHRAPEPVPSSEEASPLTLASADSDTLDCSLSDLPSERPSPLSPGRAAPPFVLLLPLPASDDNNNPSEPQPGCGLDSRGDADGLSDHSADSIDFFSAREKFLGLAQDGRLRTPSEQAQHRTPPSPEDDSGEELDREGEEASPQSDDSPDCGPQDNGVSVRHLVTEIEAISHPASSCLRPEPQADVAEAEEAACHGPATPPPPSPSGPQSPSMLPRDWPAGSVRRATEQLEQKLRQEMELAAAQRSPLHSPSAEHPPIRLPGAPEPRITQGESTAPPPRPKDIERERASQHSSGTDPPCSPRPALVRRPGASPTPDNRPPTPPEEDTSARMCVDGVTAQESDTDGDGGGCGPGCQAQSRLARGSQELERIQQTLRELQAFLHEGGGGGLDAPAAPQGPREPMDTELGPPAGPLLRDRPDGAGFLESAAWRRAVELEARMRQAGLTPPSLMKRSASLAKLDCLELSANDLSDLDLRPHARAPASSHSQDCFSAAACHPDDSWKKQKVLARNPDRTAALSGRPLDEASSTPSLCFSPPPPPPPPSARCEREEPGEREEPDGGGGITVATRQQGRGHSSRRQRKASSDKKQQRAVTVLYNTM